MLIIKVWCLPKETEARLQNLHQIIVGAVMAVKELGIDEENMMVLFPADMMLYGLGSTIAIEISSLFEETYETRFTFNKLCSNLQRGFDQFYPDASLSFWITQFKLVNGVWVAQTQNPVQEMR